MMRYADLTVRKIAARIPISTEMWEDAQWFRWHMDGTTGDPMLDARFAAEWAADRYPFTSWENEGGAL